MPTKSILVVIGRSYRYQFKCNYLKNQKRFAALLFAVLESALNFEPSEKNGPHCLNISEIIYSEKRAYLNV